LGVAGGTNYSYFFFEIEEVLKEKKKKKGKSIPLTGSEGP
jgi:hypothetical protein